MKQIYKDSRYTANLVTDDSGYIIDHNLNKTIVFTVKDDKIDTLEDLSLSIVNKINKALKKVV